MHIRCPHCHQPVELVENAPLEQIGCPSCGSQFNLLGEETVDRRVDAGRTLGRFELVERLGMGQFGTVWRARDTELDRAVALKLPRQERLSRAEVELFLREARAAAQLRHPNIVSVHEVGRESDAVYIVSDLVCGVTLADRLASGRFSPREAATLCAIVADALQHAHQAGVIHRDMKPSNIMLDAAGQPHLMDFGLAKREAGEITMTMEGRILGTPAYMSPEQARGEAHHADARSDVYSLGTILFELLTGELPFRGNKRMLLMQIIHDEPPSPRRLDAAVPRDLEIICLKCLEKSPDRRYNTARDVAEELLRYLAGQSIRARPVNRLERSWRWCRRNPMVAASAMCVAIVLLTGGGISTYFAIAERAAKLEAERAAQRERNQSIAAKSERDRADREAAAAVAARDAAEAAARDAKLQGAAAERQARRAEALRLASVARSVRAEYPQRSALLALAAAETTLLAGDPIVPAAQESMYEALDALGGIPLGEDIAHRADSRHRVAISPDGHWLVTGGNAIRRFDLTLPDPTAAPHTVCRESNVNVMAITPDSRRLVSTAAALGVAVKENAVRLWNLTEANPAGPAATLIGHDGWIDGVSVSPDGRWLVTHSHDRTFRIWDLSASDPSALAVVLRPDETKPYYTRGGEDFMPISPDNRWLATVSEGEAFLWNLRDVVDGMRPVRLTDGIDAWVSRLAMTPDGRTLITAHRDGRMRFWNLLSDDPAQGPVLERNTGDIMSLALRPDGQWLATGGFDGRLAHSNLASLSASADGNGFFMRSMMKQGIREITYSSDGCRLIAATTGKAVGLYRCDRRHDLRGMITWLTGHDENVVSLAVSRSGRWFATAGRDGTARLWNLAGWNPTGRDTVLGHETTVRHIATTADGRWLATASGPSVRLWDLTAPRPSLTEAALPGHVANVTSLAASADSHWLATASGEAVARLWDLRQSNPSDEPVLLPGEAPVTTVVFSADGSRLAMDGTVARVWNLRGKRPASKALTLDEPSPIGLLAMSGNGQRVAGAARQTVGVWDLDAEGKEPHARTLGKFNAAVESVVMSADGQWIAARSVNHGEAFRVWCINTGNVEEKTISEQPAAARPARLLDNRRVPMRSFLHIDPRGRWIVEQIPVYVNEWRTNLCDLWGFDDRAASNGCFSNRVSTLVLDRQGKWLATGDVDGIIRLGNLTDNDPSANPIRLTGIVGQFGRLAFSADSRWLAASDQDNVVRLWDLDRDDPNQSMVTLRGHTAEVTSLEFSGAGRWLATASDDRTVRLWNLDEQELVRRVRNSIGRELTPIERQTYQVTEPSLPPVAGVNVAKLQRFTQVPMPDPTQQAKDVQPRLHVAHVAAGRHVPSVRPATYGRGRRAAIDTTTGCVPDALEAEKLEVSQLSEGVITVQDMAPFGKGNWSGGKQLYWRGGSIGATLSLLLPIKHDGKYAISGVLTMADDYGAVQLRIDGEPLGEPLDLFNDGVGDALTTDEISFGERVLSKGKHMLSLHIIGAHPLSKPQYMVGLDYIRLEAIEPQAN